MPTVTTARGRMWIADHRRGSGGATAILIHGAGGSHLSFPKELRRLTALNSILVDLSGHGKSGGGGQQEISEYALDIIALMDALGLDSAILIGHSMGGAIALWLGRHHPERVSALVLAGTGARLPVNPALIASIVTDTNSTIDKIGAWMWSDEASVDQVARSAAIIRATDPPILQRDFIACDRFDIRECLPKIMAPALVIAGERDKMTPPALSEELAQGLPKARLFLAHRAGHMMLLERSAETVAAIEAWLAQARG